MVLDVADEKSPAPKEKKPQHTTVRIEDEDGDDISDLASLDGKTAAEIYKEYVRPIIRPILQKRLQERLKRLK